MLNNNEITVSVCMLTYNHELFIRQAIEGVLMQETDFPFEVLIQDDASTDSTADIVREYEAKYPDIIKPIYQTENQFSKGVIVIMPLFKKAKGKYIALCEGDDYWTDPQKLQKQVDFLEANLDYSLCCHCYKVFNVETKKWDNDYEPALFVKNNIEFIDIDLTNYFRVWLTHPLTVIFRINMLCLQDLGKYQYTRDVHLFFHLLLNGKGRCFNFIGGVYNLHKGGIHGSLSFNKRVYNSLLIHRDLYSYNKNVKELKKSYLRAIRNCFILILKVKYFNNSNNISSANELTLKELKQEYKKVSKTLFPLCKLIIAIISRIPHAIIRKIKGETLK
jgi:glycosyltransferase involved in cell wall biosynthesis